MNAVAGARQRRVLKTVFSRAQAEGMGATVRRSIGNAECRNFDPFLMLDEFSVAAPAGFPDHPHRGFETVTYMLSGASFVHEDFKGHRGEIGVGDLQWMCAGRGIVHSEMPQSKEPSHGLQLWVNLKGRDKMCEPSYQELVAKDVPLAIGKGENEGVEVKVIAGTSLGIKSPIYTRTPTMYLDITLQPGAALSQEVPSGWNAFVYTLSGELTTTSSKSNSNGDGDSSTMKVAPHYTGEDIFAYVQMS